jgi:hypothetical protein
MTALPSLCLPLPPPLLFCLHAHSSLQTNLRLLLGREPIGHHFGLHLQLDPLVHLAALLRRSDVVLDAGVLRGEVATGHASLRGRAGGRKRVRTMNSKGGQGECE